MTDGRTDGRSRLHFLKKRRDKNAASVSEVLALFSWSSEGYI